MSGAQIAAEVAAALAEAGTATGAGPLVGFLAAAGVGGNPWDMQGAGADPVAVTIVLDAYKAHEIDGTLVRSGDKKVMMNATGPVPKTGDTLTIGGRGHRIEAVVQLAPGGFALMYEVQARETGA